MADNNASKTLKLSTRTMFFDVLKTKEGKPYLKITESRIKGEERLRNTIVIFPEDVEDFKKTFEEMLTLVK